MPNAPLTATLGEFLRSRRDRLSPDQAGISSYGSRRVPGLRREELAQLAGVSPTYYTRLEQGQSTNASESVIDALARALELNDDEAAHLRELARPSQDRRRSSPRPAKAREGTIRLLESMGDMPAVLLGRRSEVLAWNRMAHVLLAGHYSYEAPGKPSTRPNLTRMLFLDAHTRDLYPRWPEEASLAVASLRSVAGRYADDRELAELVGELSVKSREFAERWSKHSIQTCTTGIKHFRHPEVGDLSLHFEVLHLPDQSGQRLIAYPAGTDASSGAALKLLAGSATASTNQTVAF